MGVLKLKEHSNVTFSKWSNMILNKFKNRCFEILKKHSVFTTVSKYFLVFFHNIHKYNNKHLLHMNKKSVLNVERTFKCNIFVTKW